MNDFNIKFDENGLVPAIIQHAETKEVLTLAYMNEQSFQKSLETGETWFYSRSRQELWHKGETSGNTQKIVEMTYDCDRDAILVMIIPNGPACHKGTMSCFTNKFYKDNKIMINNSGQRVSGSIDKLTQLQTQTNEENNLEILAQLEKVIASRDESRPEGSYTTYLFNEGVDKILKKVGEEASEVIIAAKNRSEDELKWEVADLIYHLFVLMREQQLPFEKVLQVLQQRHLEGQSTNE